MSSKIFLLGAPSGLVPLARTRSCVAPKPGAMGETVWAQGLLGGNLPDRKGVTA